MDFTKFKNFPNLEPKQQQYLGYAGVLLLTIIAIVFLIFLQQKWPTDIFEPLGFTRVEEVTTGVIPKKSAAEIAESNYSYEEAVAAYSGHRFQIYNCQATPTSVTFKNGTRVMLDSKSEHIQKITIGSQSLQLGGFESNYITLSSPSLPATLSMHCAQEGKNFYNIATILLQQ